MKVVEAFGWFWKFVFLKPGHCPAEAEHFPSGNREDGSSNSERANSQRKIRTLLETLIVEIMKENQIDNAIIDINSPAF